MIPITKPFLGEEETKAASEAILSGWVSQGPMVKAFENDFASYVGSKHAVAVSSCTTGLHLALICAGVGEGDEVICPSFSFIATANAVKYCGANPVFVDIDPKTYNIDPQKVSAAVNKKTKAILAVHQIGLPADLPKLLQIGKEHGIPVIEDAACAIGARIGVDMIGKPHGLMACFSFHPRKVITTGEGGMITTNDAKIDERLRLLRQHAMNVSDLVRHGSKKVIFEQYTELGYNYRMTDIQAAIGIQQLKKLDGILEKRREKAAIYDKALAGIAQISVPYVPEGFRHTYQSYMIRVNKNSKSSRDRIMEIFQDNGISTRRGIMSSHLEPAYAGHKNKYPLTESERATSDCVILPLYHTLEENDQQRIINLLKECVI